MQIPAVMIIGVLPCAYPAPLFTATLACHMVTTVVLLCPGFAFGAILNTSHAASRPEAQISVSADHTPRAGVRLQVAFSANIGLTF